MTSLKKQTIKGVAWSTIQRFSTLCISFVSNLVLARLLSPDDFGCIGILVVFISISQTFIDSGFGSALIQKKTPTQDDYSTIFFWNIGVSVLIYIVLYCLAPIIARFYNINIITDILRVQGLIIIINSFRIVQYNKLRKSLKFKKISIITILADIIAVITAIILAYQGYGVWCLVTQQLLLSTLTTLLFWLSSDWKPSLVFSKDSFKELFSFGGYILLSNIFVTLFNDIQSLIIGKLYSVRNVGLYTQSRRLESIPAGTISAVVSQVVFPLFSKYQNDTYTLKEILKKITRTLAFVVFPLMVIAIIIAEPLIIILFSDKWIDCVPFFRILCIGGIAESLCDINYNMVAALGKSKTLFRWTIIKSFAGLVLICAGALFGINGIIWAVTIRFFLIYIINSSLSAYYLNMSIQEQYKDLIKIFVITGLSYIITIIINSNIYVNNIYIAALIEGSIFYSIYYLLNFLLNKNVILEIKDIAKIFMQKK